MSKMNSPGWGESPPGDPKNAHRRGGLYTHYTNPSGLAFARGFPSTPKSKENASRLTRPLAAWMPLASLDHSRHGCLSPHSTTRGMDASRLTRPFDHSTTKKDSRAKALLSHRRKNNFSPISTDVFANFLAHHRRYMKQAAQLFLLYRQHHTLNTHTKFLSSHLRQFH